MPILLSCAEIWPTKYLGGEGQEQAKGEAGEAQECGGGKGGERGERKEVGKPLNLRALPSQTYKVPACLGTFTRIAFTWNALPRAGSSEFTCTHMRKEGGCVWGGD